MNHKVFKVLNYKMATKKLPENTKDK